MAFQWPQSPRVYGILDAGYVSRADWTAKCEALVKGGADIIQLRAKGLSVRERRVLLESILTLFAKDAPPLVINDDWELAQEYPGLGVHVGQDDCPVEQVRAALGGDRVIGLSTHSPTQAEGAIAQAELLDYFAVGPVFATPTKPDYEPVGLGLVRTVAALNPPLPWFCIGGVNRANASEVIQAGAPALVAVSDLLQANDTAAAVRELRAVF